MYVYNISGGVANIFTRIVQIDNNQQVYEVQIQVPRCNSILKAGSHECQKLGPLTFESIKIKMVIIIIIIIKQSVNKNNG
jgi:hypothetical protein